MTYPPYPSSDPRDQATPPVPAAPPSAPPAGFHYPPPPERLHGIGLAAIWLAALVAAFEVVEAGLAWHAQARYLQAAEDGLSSLDVYTPYEVVGLGWTAMILAAYVVTCLWLYRARTNTNLMQPHLHHARSRGWAWGGWICPVVSLWFPFQVVRDVGRDQDGRRVTSRLGAWWTFWLLGLVSSQIGSNLIGLDDEINTDAISALGTVETVNAVIMLVALAFWIPIVRAISAHQDQMMGATR